jgi:hypothetical protein
MLNWLRSPTRFFIMLYNINDYVSVNINRKQHQAKLMLRGVDWRFVCSKSCTFGIALYFSAYVYNSLLFPLREFIKISYFYLSWLCILRSCFSERSSSFIWCFICPSTFYNSVPFSPISWLLNCNVVLFYITDSLRIICGMSIILLANPVLSSEQTAL